MRGPMKGETALSQAEVDYGVEEEIFDGFPLQQISKPAGSWEIGNVHLMAKAQPFDGLLG